MFSRSDESLYLRWVDGDLAAFDALYARYEGPLFGFLTRQLGSTADAEDALHETFTPEDTAARRVAFEARIGDAALDALTPDRHPDRLSRAHLLAALPTRLGGLATG